MSESVESSVIVKVVKWLFFGVAALCLTIGIGVGIAWILTAPRELPKGSESAYRLAPGPYNVGYVEFEWIDGSRSTAKNSDYPGSSQREFPEI